MARPEKVAEVKNLKQKLEASEAVFLTEYAGLTVGQQQQLRRGLRAGDAEYKVVKMSLTRLAADELELAEEFTILLTGPTAIAFASDPAIAAKTLAEFGKDHEALKIKGMLLAGEMLPPEKVAELAKLDSREVMLAKVAGIIQAPMSNFAGMMAAFTANAANMFLQLKERKEKDAPPAEEPVAAEVATEELAGEEAPLAEEPATEAAAAVSEEPSADEPGAEGSAAGIGADDAKEDSAPEADAASDEADSDSEEDVGEETASSEDDQEENNDG